MIMTPANTTSFPTLPAPLKRESFLVYPAILLWINWRQITGNVRESDFGKKWQQQSD
jgi:hypothetical protein